MSHVEALSESTGLPPLSDNATALDGLDAGVVISESGAAVSGIGLSITGTDVRVAQVSLSAFSCNPACLLGTDADRLLVDRVTLLGSSSLMGNASAVLSLVSCNSATVIDSTIRVLGTGLAGTEEAVCVEFTGNARLLGNDITGSVEFRDSVNLEIDSNTVQDARERCIYLDRSDGATVSGNTVRDCADNGIHVYRSSQIELLANTVRRADNGIYVRNGTDFHIEGNIVENNSGDGIFIERTSCCSVVAAAAVVFNNVAQFNLGAGVRSSTYVSQVEITENSITANGTGLTIKWTSAPVPPLITSFDGTTVGGSAAPDGARVEVFLDPGVQAQQFLGSGTVMAGSFSIAVTIPPSGTTGKSLTATVTSGGTTSQLSAGWLL